MSDVKHLILVECEDRKGLVADISRTLFERGLNITSNDEFVDPDTGRFFMRTEIEGAVQEQTLAASLEPLVPKGGRLRIADKAPKNWW